MATIYILWLRQLKRFWRTKPRVVAALAQPVLYLVALGFGFGPIYAKAGGGNYIQFLAPGVIGMTIIFASMFSGIEIIWEKQIGFIKETLVAPVSRFHIMLGRIFGGATVSLVQGILVFLITLLVGFHPVDWSRAPLALLSMALIAFLFTAFGTAIGAWLDDMQSFPLIINFVMMPLFFLSGALFPVDQLPAALKLATIINPLSYGIDGIRGGLDSVWHFAPYLDFGVVALISLAVLAIGAWLFSRIEV